MPFDIDLFRLLSADEQDELRDKLAKDLSDIEKQLDRVEEKLKATMLDDAIKYSDLSPLLSYRDELRRQLNRLRYDLDQIESFVLEGGNHRPNPVHIARTTSGAGIVNIRADDTKARKIHRAKPYSDIVVIDVAQEKKDDQIINKIIDKLKGDEGRTKAEQAKAKAETQAHTPSQTSKK
jgi:hypothetical protein